MTQKHKKRQHDEIVTQYGRDNRPVVESCELLSSNEAVGTSIPSVLHSTAQTKIMISAGGTRGCLSHQKRSYNRLIKGKTTIPDGFLPLPHPNATLNTSASQKVQAKKPIKKATKTKSKAKAKAIAPKQMSNLTISTRDRVLISRLNESESGRTAEEEGTIALRNVRVMHKFVSGSSKIDFLVQDKRPVMLQIFQGYGDQEREIATLLST